MAGKRKNGEGCWGKKIIKGVQYRYYRDINGRYYYGKTEKEIKEKIKRAPSTPVKKDKSHNVTLGEYILEWLNGIKSGIELTTYNSYIDAINTRLINFKDYDIANVELSALTDKMLQEYLNALAKRYSLNSIRKTWGLIVKCLRYAEVKKDVQPLYLDVTVKTPSESNVAVKKKDIKAPTIDDINFIIEEANSFCKNGSKKYGNAAYVIILIMYTGMRVSEAIGLQWRNVNLDKKEINIDHSLAIVRDELKDGKTHYRYIEKAAKTKDSIRKIPLPDKALEAIRYFEKYRTSDNDYVCVNDKNKNHYTKRQVERTLARIVQNSQCENKSFTPHSLRHGYGSILLSKGIDIKIVSELLGHSDVSFTYNVYIDIFEKDKQNAVNLLNTI